MAEQPNPQEFVESIRNIYVKSYHTPEENKALCEKYPFLTWHGDPLYLGYDPNKESDYRTTWEDELPPGWQKAFCPQIWDELKAILEKADYVDKFSFMQIKEKFGTLRLYSSGSPESIWHEIVDWEMKYDHLSEEYCIECGKPTAYMTTGWITYICEDCANKHKEQDKKDGYRPGLVPLKDLKLYSEDPQKYFKEHPWKD